MYPLDYAPSERLFTKTWTAGMRVGKASGKEWLRLGEAADALGVSLNTLRRWTDSGKLVCYRSPGGHRRYRRSHVEALLSRQSGAPAASETPNLTRHAVAPASAEELRTSLALLAALAADGIAATSCVIALHTPDKALRIVADYAQGGRARPTEVGTASPLERAPIASEVLRSGRRLVIADLATTKLLSHAEAEIYRSRGDAAVLAVPLLIAGRVAGVMELAERHAPRSFTGANISFAEFIASQAARLIAGKTELEGRGSDKPGGLAVTPSSPHLEAPTFSAALEGTVQALVDTLRAKLGVAAVRVQPSMPDQGTLALIPAAERQAAALLAERPRGARLRDEHGEIDASGGVLRVPLPFDGAVVGHLEVVLARPDDVLSPGQIALLEATATVAGLALGGGASGGAALSDDAEQAASRPQPTLPGEFLPTLDAPPPFGAAEQPLQAALDALRGQFSIDVCSLYRVADDTATLVARTAGVASPLPNSWPLADSLPARLALASRTTIVLHSGALTETAPEGAARHLAARRLSGALLAPLVFAGRTLGFLEAGSSTSADLQAAVPVVEIAAGLLAAVLAADDAAAGLRRHARDLELVVEADLEGTPRLTTGEALHDIAERLATLSHSPVADIFAVEGDTLRALVSYDRDRFDRAREGVVIPMPRYPCAVRAVDTGEISIVTSLNDPSLSAEGRYSLEKWGYQSQLSLPLIWGGRVIGLAQLSDYVPRDFRPNLELIRGLGQVAARALQNVILFQQAERRSRALNGLLELGDLSSRVHDLDTLVRRMAERLQAAVDVANCDIYEMCPDGLRCVASYDRSGHDERLVGNLLDPLSYPTVIAAMNSRKILVVTAPDDPQLSEDERRTYREFGFASEVCIPLIVNDELYGAIDIYDTRERDYVDFLGFFESAGRLLAGACENALLHDRLQRRAGALHAIVELAAGSQTCDPQDVCALIAERLRAAIEAAGCTIFTLHDERLRCVVSVNDQGVDAAAQGMMLPMSGLPATVVRPGAPQALVIDTPDDPRLSDEEREEMRTSGCLSRLCIPLVAHERTIGLIDLRDERPRDYGEYLDFTASIARIAAGMIEKALHTSELESDSRKGRNASRA